MGSSTAWPDRNSRSAELYERARAVLPGGISRLQTWVDPYPIYAGRGEGATIVDVDGVRRLDLRHSRRKRSAASVANAECMPAFWSQKKFPGLSGGPSGYPVR